MDKINHHRRRVLSLGAVALGGLLLPKTLLAAQPIANKPATRTLYVKALNLNETLRSTYFDGTDYVPEELDKLNYLFRDRRSHESIEMDVQVYDQLYQLQTYFGHDKAIMMICGYRSPVTNDQLKKSNTGVADKSYHISGQAVDFYIEDVPLKMVQEAALAMKVGGVGYYPKSNFVHVDTGPVRFWPRDSGNTESTLIKGRPEPLPSVSTASVTNKASAVRPVSPSMTKVSNKSVVKNKNVKRLAP
jgi:uncharacterized protein YcbK (DUF882 family)